MKSNKNSLVNLKSSKKISVIITEKKRLEALIKSDWVKLLKNNQVLNNTKRDFDIEILYKGILKNEQTLLQYKLAIAAANIGLTTVPEDCNYKDIYKLSNLELRKSKLEELLKFCRNEEISTNKHPVVFNSVFTKEIIYTFIAEAQHDIDTINQKLVLFNNRDFDINVLPF